MHNKPTLTLKTVPKSVRSRPKAASKKKAARAKTKQNISAGTHLKKTQHIPADARKAACFILNDIISNQMTSDAAERNQPQFSQLEPRDRGFVKLLVATCLRRYGQINILLSQRLSDHTPALVRRALELGVCQYLFLKTKPHAAANTTVELVKALGFSRQSGLANAVIRHCIRTGDAELAETSITDNLPVDWQTRWRSAYGDEYVKRLAGMLTHIPALDISAQSDVPELAQKLGGVALNTQTIRCPFGGDVKAMAGYDDGNWWVQDAAAALPAQLFGDVHGLHIWDWCAAPGGKSAQLASRGAHVSSFDNDEVRLNRLAENMNRLKLSSKIICDDVTSETVANMAADTPPDGILLDAPCSATGTYRRRPDMLRRKPKLDIAALAETQKQMLSAAISLLGVGKTVIYATCSLEPEEGEEVVSEILNRFSQKVAISSFQPAELGLFSSSLCAEGWARVMPDCLTSETSDIPSGNDGFFIARLQIIAA